MGEKAAQWRDGVRDGVPILLGYLAVSFTFGIASRGILTPVQATLVSLTNLTSAGQFASLEQIRSLAPLLELAAAQLVINLRYCLMSCALSQKLDPRTGILHRLVMAGGVTDEVFSVSVGRRGVLSPYYVYGLMTAAIPGWSIGTLLGAASGGVMPPRVLNALSVALYAMFLAVVMPPVRTSRVVGGVVLISMAASFAVDRLPVLSGVTGGVKVIVLTLLIAGAAALRFPVTEMDLGEGAEPGPDDGRGLSRGGDA